MAYVYRHIRLDKNIPFYIGISLIDDIEYKRANVRSGRNKHWQNVVKKSDYRVDIMFDEIESDFAKEKEIELIALYGRVDLKTGTLVNRTIGGDGNNGMIVSEYTRKLISESSKKRVVSAETRAKMSKAMTGFKHSPETIAKLIEYHKNRTDAHKASMKGVNKGKKRTEEQIKAMIELKRGTKASEETKLKMSLAHTGIKHTEETKLLISMKTRGRVKSEEERKNIALAWIKRKEKFKKVVKEEKLN